MLDLFPKNCDDSHELESTCGGYCFQSIRYILDHTKFLQRHYDERNQLMETSTEKVLRELQQELHAQGRRLQDVGAKLGVPAATAVSTTPFRKIGNKYYYIEENQRLNWFGAHHYCLSLNAHLASVHNQSEMDALVKESKNNFYWLDINDLSTEGEFLSSTTGKKPIYFNWAPNEPNNALGNEDCVILVSYNSINNMNDEVCEKVSFFICEKDFSE